MIRGWFVMRGKRKGVAAVPADTAETTHAGEADAAAIEVAERVEAILRSVDEAGDLGPCVSGKGGSVQAADLS